MLIEADETVLKRMQGWVKITAAYGHRHSPLYQANEYLLQQDFCFVALV